MGIEEEKARLLAEANATEAYGEFVGGGISNLISEATDYNRSKVENVLNRTPIEIAINATSAITDPVFTPLTSNLPEAKAQELGIADFINKYNGRAEAISRMTEEALGHLVAALEIFEEIHPELSTFDQTTLRASVYFSEETELLRHEAELL